MRTVLFAIVVLAACSGTAQSQTRYDLYIFEPHGGGPQTYVFTGGNAASAVEVRGCGDVHVLPDARAVAASLSARRHAQDVSVVTVSARGSRVDLDSCPPDEEGDEPNEHDSLVVVENANASQMRRMIQSLDAAPSDVRSQISATLGLD
ncbi:MAG: hypothetical protein NT015_00060 [Alphaproteobacteria bacterium]|nr:hypothetical protein [Alphaproteobacteria bacterium]